MHESHKREIKYQGNNANAYGEEQGRSVARHNITSLLSHLRLDSRCKAQPETVPIEKQGAYERTRDTLLAAADGVARDDLGCGVDQIRTKGRYNRAGEYLIPVGLLRRHGRNEKVS